MPRRFTLSIIALLAAFILQGCAHSGYTIIEPVPSQIQFAASAADVSGDIAIRDARGANPEYFSFGVLPAELRIDGAAFDPIEFLREHVAVELDARGIESTVSESGALSVDVKTLRMRNHRTNAYTPFITLTMLSADVQTPEGAQPLGVFIVRGKVPVWSFSEVVEPIFTQPMDLLVKELVAKLNAILFGQSISDQAVRDLTQQIESGPVDERTFLSVYQLGFGNNSSAISALAGMAKHENQYVRLAAISSLGTLRATDHVDLLKSIYEESKEWDDRAMALKALGDIGTTDCVNYLRSTRSQLQSASGKENEWNAEIIDLYLRDS
jgi:hypothetical protein